MVKVVNQRTLSPPYRQQEGGALAADKSQRQHSGYHRVAMQSSIHGERRVSEESENPTELIPDIEEAKFFTLGAQLLVIGGLANQDLRFKVYFCDRQCNYCVGGTHGCGRVRGTGITHVFYELNLSRPTHRGVRSFRRLCQVA